MLTIIVGQLPKIFGVEKGEGSFFEQAWDLLTNLDERSGLTLLVGALSLALVVGLKEVAPVVPGPAPPASHRVVGRPGVDPPQ